MDRSGKPDATRATERQRLHSLAETFHEAWKNSTSVDLQRFLPPVGDPLRRAALQELVKADLTIRWQRRQQAFLETYLKKYPELGNSASVPSELIYHEMRARQQHGDAPDLADYRRRFPAQFPTVEQQLREEQTQAVPAPAPVRSAAVQRSAAPSRGPTSDLPEAATVAVPSKPADSVTIVNGFKLFKKLGSGSFAEVWQGESPGGFPVAVKRIMKALDDSQAQRELQSLHTIKRLRHMFLLQTHDCFAIDNQLYVVMELADGTLRDRQKQCRKEGQFGIPLPELMCYFRESAEALDYMHKQQMIHRDIKPANILIMNGHAKLADFGLAMLQESERLMFTASGSGTPAYMAPEVWQRKVSTHSDQYSLAFTYAEQRLGRWVFDGRDMVSLMHDHLSTDPNLGDLPPTEQVVLRKALAKDANQRYPNCSAFIQALEEALVDELQKSRPSIYQRGPLSPSSQGLMRHSSSGSHTHADGSRKTQAASNPSATQALLPAPTLPVTRRRWLGVLLMSFIGGGAVAVAAWYLRPPAGSTETGPTPPFVLAEPGQLEVGAGAVGVLSLKVKRHACNGDIKLEFLNLPTPCQADDPMICEGTDDGSVTVLVGPEVEPKLYSVTIRATAAGQTQDVPWQLRVKKPVYQLPEGWKRVEGTELVENKFDKKAYHQEIDVKRGGLDVRFRLIAQKRPTDPATFYIMEDKVWVNLFARFANDPKRDLKVKGWDELTVNKGDSEKPVMGVYVADADEFAKWMGGKLPLPRQWDKAAGKFDPKEGQVGPFEPDFKQGEVAVSLNPKEPLPAPMRRGAAKKDRSPFGCNDMAANGEEWTGKEVVEEGEDDGQRTLNIGKRGEEASVYIRSQKYTQRQPWRYTDPPRPKPAEPIGGQKLDNTIGFRVVLELDAPER